MEKLEERRPLRRPRRRWENNIKMDLTEVGARAGSILLSIGTRDALVNAVMNLQFP